MAGYFRLRKQDTSVIYPDRPLTNKKIGIKQKKDKTIVNPLLPLEKIFDTPLSNFKIKNSLEGSFDLIQYLTASRQDLESSFPKLKSSLRETGSLWISWPKSSSKIPSDLNENLICEVGLRNSLVDSKVTAVGPNYWSGLKFFHRLKIGKEVSFNVFPG